MTDLPDAHIRRVSTLHGPMWVFDTDLFVSRSLAYYGEYAEGEVDLFRQLVRPGSVVVEAGANIGSHTVFLARACAPAPLFAFEPQQRAFQLLCANLTINGVTNALTFPEALGSEAGSAEIALPNYARPDNVGGATLAPLEGPSAGGKASVRVSRLDDWRLPACAFLKIDVEGWEREVILGARETIAHCRPVMYVENDRKEKQGTLIEFIASLGYRQYWHLAPLYRPNNFNGRTDDLFGNIVALNMLCLPNELEIPISGFEQIDPGNWRSPIEFVR